MANLNNAANAGTGGKRHPANARELLTASRMNAFLACPRKHFYSHELGLRKAEPSGALRFGTAFHKALEVKALGGTPEDAYAAAIATGTFVDTDAATLYGLIGGYFAHYQGEADAIDRMHPEVEFNLPITGSRTFAAAGKIDGLAILKDGRTALVEHKTCGEDISAGAAYWERLRFNLQLYTYVLAARANGWDVETVVYDVIRKPSIRVKQNETPEEFGERLLKDCAERPEFYFARREVAILEDHLREFEIQRDVMCKMLLHCKAAARKAELPEYGWVRNCNGVTCRACEYAELCLQNVHVDADNIPGGFVIAPLNPELEQSQRAAGAVDCGNANNAK